MNLLILGATGNMGQRLLAQGLARGHAVTAFVRNRAKLEQQLGPSLPQGLTVVEGNTDERGSDEYNMVLGGRRAESVKQYLANEGLGKSQMETTSRGELDAKGFNEETWAKDRRVDVLLAGTKSANPDIKSRG